MATPWPWRPVLRRLCYLSPARVRLGLAGRSGDQERSRKKGRVFRAPCGAVCIHASAKGGGRGRCFRPIVQRACCRFMLHVVTDFVFYQATTGRPNLLNALRYLGCQHWVTASTAVNSVAAPRSRPKRRRAWSVRGVIARVATPRLRPSSLAWTARSVASRRSCPSSRT